MLEALAAGGQAPAPSGAPMAIATAAELVAAWRDAGPARWFAKAPDLDAELAARFGAAHRAATRGELGDWCETAQGGLAFVLLTDQLSRHLHRGGALAFAADPLARAAAEGALRRGFDRATPPDLRPFLYMPLEHAEDEVAQARAVALFARFAEETGDPRRFLRSALQHQEVIRRFGRFPHRNAVLGRTSTPAEEAFLRGGGFAG